MLRVCGINGDIRVNFFSLCVFDGFCVIWFICVRVVFDYKGLEVRICVLFGLNGVYLGLYVIECFLMMGG